VSSHAGEFGAVHRGTYNGRPVAVKVIGLTGTAYSSGRNSVDEFFRQMHLEISTMSHVGSHPNCISMFGCAGRFPDSGEGKDALCIQLILELMPNGTLFDALHQKRQVAEWGEKIKVLRGIAAGVQHLHSRSIVHRDLSSLNILFSADMQPKIADFGCARKCVGGVYDPRKVLGSPAYMSPEQLVGSKLTTKSDCWSLGVLIWEVLSERGPWNDRDSNNRQLLKLHIVDNGAKLPAISAQRFEVLYAKHYEAQVAELLAGCFRVTPAKRSTASDIAR
jgi:serine/threonine protein kinase